jgi:hypothetical protein
MRSSQALTQSVFGTIKVLDHLRLLSSVVAEGGRPAFGPTLNETTLELEKPVGTLGEQPGRSTSVDVWWGSGPYRVAVECKLSEATFGTCSRPRLDPKDAQHCDGSYAQQGERKARCALTEIGIRYWNYADDLFGWRADVDHQPCPLQSSYQLVRNILAACVKDDGSLSVDNGHALIIYDGRNPTMAFGGDGDRQWSATYNALRPTGVLRRLSWQVFIAQWPIHPAFDWMKNELRAKYGIMGAS